MCTISTRPCVILKAIRAGVGFGLGPRLILCMHFSHSTDDGCFLGINPNFKIYVKGLSLRKVREAEQSAEDDADLARKLFLLIFKQELAEKPHGVCCTEADGRVAESDLPDNHPL